MDTVAPSTLILRPCIASAADGAEGHESTAPGTEDDPAEGPGLSAYNGGGSE